MASPRMEDPYVSPGTDLLRNKLILRDADELAAKRLLRARRTHFDVYCCG